MQSLGQVSVNKTRKDFGDLCYELRLKFGGFVDSLARLDVDLRSAKTAHLVAFMQIEVNDKLSSF